MSLRGRKLGMLVSCRPDEPNFIRALRLAESALGRGVDVYMYCIDNAVMGAGSEPLQNLVRQGLKLYACAYGARRRNLAVTHDAALAGLTVVSDLITATDKFVSFN